MQYEPSLMRALRCFSHHDVRNFTELADDLSMETDLAGYYLRKLQTKQLVSNIARGKYQITAFGKSVLAHQKQISGLVAVPRVSVLLIVESSDGFLVTRRKKQPFLNKLEWPVVSLKLGEPLPTAATRLATIRLGLDIDPEYRGTFRCIDRYGDTAFDDKLFAVHIAKLTSEQSSSHSSNDVGEIVHMSAEKLTSDPQRNPNVIDILEFSTNLNTYHEAVYSLEPEDLFS